MELVRPDKQLTQNDKEFIFNNYRSDRIGTTGPSVHFPLKCLLMLAVVVIRPSL